MKKLKHYKEEISITQDDFETKDFSSLERYGIYADHKPGIEKYTIGKPLQFNEFFGEGLPELEKESSVYFEMNLSFDIRVSHNGRGDIELVVAQNGKGTHFKFNLKGLNAKQAETAIFEFRRQMTNSAIAKDFYYFIWACYRKQDENADKRKESYEKILSNLEIRFKKLLRWDRYKEVENRKENEIEIIKLVPIERGAKPKSKSEIDKEKIEFLQNVFSAFRELDKKRIKSPKQRDLMPYIYKRHKDIEKKISESLIKHKLDFNHLWQTYLSDKNLESFLNISISTNRVSDN